MTDRFSTFDWDDLRFFLAVARAGTLRGGADTIRANHATVARRLAALEAGIDARLFDRTKTGLKLTQLGEQLLPRARRVEEEIASASRIVAGRDARPSGDIHVSIPPCISLTSIASDIADFSRDYPAIELHLEVTNSFVDLARREADVTLRMAHEVTDDVVGRRVVRYAKGIYCAPAYAATMTNNGGKGLTWIGWSEDSGEISSPWIKKSPFPQATLRHRINEAVPQMTMAAAGLGLTYLPCFVADNFPGLVRAPYQAPALDRSIWLLLHNDLRNTARIRVFVDFLVRRIRGRKAEFVAGAIA